MKQMDNEEIFNIIENSLEGNAHLDDLAKRGHDPFKILISTIFMLSIQKF